MGRNSPKYLFKTAMNVRIVEGSYNLLAQKEFLAVREVFLLVCLI